MLGAGVKPSEEAAAEASSLLGPAVVASFRPRGANPRASAATSSGAAAAAARGGDRPGDFTESLRRCRGGDPGGAEPSGCPLPGDRRLVTGLFGLRLGLPGAQMAAATAAGSRGCGERGCGPGDLQESRRRLRGGEVGAGGVVTSTRICQSLAAVAAGS